MKTVISANPDIAFNPFSERHLDGGVALSSAEGWSHRREDWEMVASFSRGVVALRGDRVVGTALRADFGGALSTLNMILVDATMRSRGLGRSLMTAAIGDDARSLRLIATMSGKPLYEKLGFETVANIACVQGIVSEAGATVGVRDATDEDLPSISALETDSFGGDRSALVRWLYEHARLAVIQQDAGAVGFAACRRFGHGYVVGPVVAPSADAGLALIKFLAKDLVGHLLRVDVTEASGLQAGLTAMGLEVQYHAPIMQRGHMTATADRLALVSQALA